MSATSSSQSQPANVTQLLGNAAADGQLSAESANMFTQIGDLGETINNALGVPPADVQASEAVLVTMMSDDSGSIRFSGNAQTVRDGHNLVLDALAASKQEDNILVHTRYLNGEVLYPYCFLSGAVRMDSGNYNPDQGTPLYDQTAILLGTVTAKAQDFLDQGVEVRTITLIITDGFDQHSHHFDANDIKKLIGDMLKTERHIIAGMGIGDEADFREIFREMGVRDEWILTPGNDEHQIRSAFAVFSKSAVQASQSAARFSATAIGGFGG